MTTTRTLPAAGIDRAPIDALVGDYALEHHCPTISWGILLDNALAATGAAGDVTDHTVYRIASMTKSFSAAATLMLRDQGVLRLDDPIDLHAPELAGLRSPTTDAPAITIRDLLSMTSGLIEDDSWADRHLDLTDDEFDRIVSDGPVFAQPTGVRFEYSNFGFAVLGRVIQRASGQRIQEIVSERLLAPLAMHQSTWLQPDHDDWAPPLRWLDDGYVAEIPSPGDGLVAPMGGIWSTVADLAKWVAWLSDAFPARDGLDDGPLARASRREMQMIQRYVGSRSLRGVRSPTGYGLGLRILDESDLGTVVTHSGGFPGYGSNMRWLPGRGVGVVALSNVTYAPMTELTACVLDLVNQQGLVPRLPVPVNPALHEAGRQLIRLFNGWTDRLADSIFADNVQWDDSYARRRNSVSCSISPPIVINEVAASDHGSATVRCTDAAGKAITITFSFAPISPPLIQEYEIVVE